jgi:hypothetical protein
MEVWPMEKIKEGVSQFYSAAAANILGLGVNTQIKGSSAKINATRDVMLASKKLYEALHDNSITLTEIRQLLADKRKKATEFEHLTGVSWIL